MIRGSKNRRRAHNYTDMLGFNADDGDATAVADVNL